MYFLFTGRKFFLTTTVYDMYLCTQSSCCSGSVHCHITTTYYDDFLTCFDRCVVIVQKSFHKVVSC